MNVEPRGGSAGCDFALSIVDGRGVLSLAGRPVVGPASLDRLDLDIPRLVFPFDLSGGAEGLRNRRCVLRSARLRTDGPRLTAFAAAALARAGAVRGHPGVTVELDGIRSGAGLLHAALVVRAGDTATPVSMLAAAHAQAGGLRLVVFDVRAFGPLEVAAPILGAHVMAACFGVPIALGLPRPLITSRSVGVHDVDALGLALLAALPPSGFRLPDRGGTSPHEPRLDRGEVTLDVGPSADGRAPGLDPAIIPAARLRARIALAEEGALRFVEGEQALARGDQREALALYRKAVAAEPTQGFAVGRLLDLLIAEPDHRDEAGDLAESVLARDPDHAPALSALAIAAEADGDWSTAATAWHRLAEADGTPAGLVLAATLKAAPLAHRAGENERARRWLEDALARASDHARAADAMALLAELRLLDPRAAPSAQAVLDEAVRREPDDPATLERLGRAHLSAGDVAQARELFAAALAIAPEAAGATGGAALAAWTDGDGVRAASLAARALAADPEQREALLVEGLRLASADGGVGLGQAAALLRRASTPPATSWVRRQALAALARLAETEGDLAGAVATLDDLGNFLDREGDDDGLAAALATRARHLLTLGRADEALDDARRAAGLRPGEVATVALVAEASVAAGDEAAAVDVARLLDEADRGRVPPSAIDRGRLVRGLVALEEGRGNVAAATQALERLLGSDVHGAEASSAWQKLVDLHGRAAQPEAAALALEKAAADARTGETARERSARLLAAAEIRRRRLDDVAGALPLLERARDLDPSNVAVLDALTAVATAAGDVTRLVAALRSRADNARRRPVERAGLLARLGHVLMTQAGDAELARAAWKEALDLDARLPAALRGLASLCRQAHDDDGERDFLRRLVDGESAASPAEREEAHLRLAELDAAAGRPDLVLDHARAAMTAAPDSVAAMDAVIAALDRVGSPADLCEVVRRRLDRERVPATRRDLAFRLGQLFEAQERPNDAATAYRDALKASPFDVAVLERLAHLARSADRPVDLARTLDRLIEVAGGAGAVAEADRAHLDEEALALELAQLAQTRLADPARAEIVLLKLLMRRPGSKPALDVLAELLVRRGALDEADRLYARRFDLASDTDERNAIVTARARARLPGPNGEAAALELLRQIDLDTAPDDALHLRAELAGRRDEPLDAALALLELSARPSAGAEAAALRERARDLVVGLPPTGSVRRDLLDRLLGLDPYDGAAALALADHLLQEDADATQKLDRLSRLLERAPGLPPEGRAHVLDLVGQAAEVAGDTERAERAYARAIAVETDVESRADLRVARARTLVHLDDPEAATMELDAALADVPEHPLALAMLGDLAYEQQDWARARDLYTRLAAVPSADLGISAEILEFRRAELAEMFGDEAAAESSYRRVADAQPGHIESREALAQAAIYRGDWREAVAVLDEVVAALPRDAIDKLADVHQKLGEAHARLGDLPRARAALEQAISLDGERLGALELLADVYERLGEWNAAVATWGRLAQVHTSPHDRATVLYRQAEILRERLGQRAAADDIYLKAVDLAPHMPQVVARVVERDWRAGDLRSVAEMAAELASSDSRAGLTHADLMSRGAVAAAAILTEPAATLDRLTAAGKPPTEIAAQALAEVAQLLPGEPERTARSVAAIRAWLGPERDHDLERAMAEVVLRNPSDPGPLRVAAQLARIAGHPATARALLSLVAFSDPDAPDAAELSKLGMAPLPAPEALSPLGPLVHPDADGSLRRVLVELAPALLRVSPPDEAGPHTQKLPAGLASTVASVAMRLRAPAFELVVREGSATCDVEIHDRPYLLVGRELLGRPQPELLFHLGTALEALRSAHDLPQRFRPRDLANLLEAIGIALLPGTRTDASPEVVELGGRLLAHLGQLRAEEQPAPGERPGLIAAAEEARRALLVAERSPERFVAGCRHTAHRTGLLVCGWPLAAFEALAQEAGVPDDPLARLRFVRESDDMRALLEFILDGSYEAILDA